jgi:hypothetical protein
MRRNSKLDGFLVLVMEGFKPPAVSLEGFQLRSCWWRDLNLRQLLRGVSTSIRGKTWGGINLSEGISTGPSGIQLRV